MFPNNTSALLGSRLVAALTQGRGWKQPIEWHSSELLSLQALNRESELYPNPDPCVVSFPS